MNEKGRCSALGGLFAVVRAAAATGRKLYERLSISPRGLFLFFNFFFLSLVYQSLRFRNYFYVPAVKGWAARVPCHEVPGLELCNLLLFVDGSAFGTRHPAFSVTLCKRILHCANRNGEVIYRLNYLESSKRFGSSMFRSKSFETVPWLQTLKS